MRQINSAGISLLKKLESCEPYVYTCSAGHQTIGIGHCLTPHELESGLLLIDGHAVEWIKGLTADQMEGLMQADLALAEWTVESSVKAPLTDNQFAALVIMALNIGTAGFQNSSVVRVLAQGRYDLVPAMMRLWNKITIKKEQPDGTVKDVKVVSHGLVDRREKEIKLWLTP
jgi:lysozyme